MLNHISIIIIIVVVAVAVIIIIVIIVVVPLFSLFGLVIKRSHGSSQHTAEKWTVERT